MGGGTFFVAVVCGCATPMGSGGEEMDLLSAGDPSAGSGITLRLLLRVTPMGSGVDTAAVSLLFG